VRVLAGAQAGGVEDLGDALLCALDDADVDLTLGAVTMRRGISGKAWGLSLHVTSLEGLCA
jgi:hypothetical protein